MKDKKEEELQADMAKIRKFVEDITEPITTAATKPDGYLDVALLFCGMGYFLDKAIDVCCKNDVAQRKTLVDWFCGALRKDYEDVE